MHPQYLEIGNQKIAYCESDGTGQPVFFLHGNSCSALAFSRQFDSSLAEKYRLIAIDLPGHGKSSKAAEPKSTYTLPGYASIIVDLAKKLRIEDALFVGWSLGGHILLEAAEKLKKARGFVIFGTPPLGKPPDMPGAFLPNPAIPILFKAVPTNDELDLWCNTLGKNLPDFFKNNLLISDGHARGEMGKSTAQLQYKDEIKIVEKLSTPLAIFHGEEDKFINFAYINNLAIPSLWLGKVQTIANAGHVPQFDQPEIFNKLLENFLSHI